MRCFLAGDAGKGVLPRNDSTDPGEWDALELLSHMLSAMPADELEMLLTSLLVRNTDANRRFKVVSEILHQLATGAGTPSEIENCGELVAVALNNIKDVTVACRHQNAINPSTPTQRPQCLTSWCLRWQVCMRASCH